MLEIGKEMMSESKYFMGYSRWMEDQNRYETWDESVGRVMDMHRQKYADKMTPALEEAIDFAEEAYKDKLVLGAQRALQFGGEQIFKHESRMYNCSSSYADRPRFFSEAFYLLLSGCGVGFSVQKHHIDRLPTIARRSPKKAKVFQIPDSIEGWADAIGVLLSSYLTEGAQFPEYKGCQVHFDFSKIRPRGAFISGGFKAPGPDGLRKTLIKCEELIENLLKEAPVLRMNSITVYDLVMHISDAVLSGGVRRSATICLFDKDDQDMLTAKTGNWFVDNPQRGRSNNSAILVRGELSRDEWSMIMKNVKQFGEPGFIFTESKEFTTNPCVTGDTLVTVKDHGVSLGGDVISDGVGYQIPMSMLVELYETQEDFHPLIKSVNLETGAIEWKEMTAAAMTRRNAEVFELRDTETGKFVRATADHKIWTQNRGYVEVKDLLPDDILKFD
jgi:ribonucleoside-diphosphate reductase alpha chain